MADSIDYLLTYQWNDVQRQDVAVFLMEPGSGKSLQDLAHLPHRLPRLVAQGRQAAGAVQSTSSLGRRSGLESSPNSAEKKALIEPGEASSAAPAWHDVAAVADLGDGKATRLDCDGRGLFVWRKGRTIRVYDSLCPHQSTDIPHLAIDGTRLTCPKHEWAFDIPTGRCVAKGDAPLNVFPHKVAKGRVLALW